MQNDLWENHVKGLTKQLSQLINKVEIVEQRLDYYEQVLITLISAFKDGGIIVEDESCKHEMPS